jgi:AcrR family transcriptional regulator
MSVTSDTQAPPRRRNERLAAIERELAGHPHRRVPRDLRRRHLLELATELFSERGFEAASMDELAQRAGVSKPVIYDQFGSKEGLVVAVVDAMGVELNEAIGAAIDGRTDPEDLLRTGSLAFFRFVGERRATFSMAFGAVRTLDSSSIPLVAKVAEIRARQDALVAAAIAATAETLGGDPDPLEISAITRGLNGIYEGLVEWWDEHPDVPASRLADWVVALVLPGLRAMSAAT